LAMARPQTATNPTTNRPRIRRRIARTLIGRYSTGAARYTFVL
jgi:hypothetical protein